jgi:hypothetical protein
LDFNAVVTTAGLISTGRRVRTVVRERFDVARRIVTLCFPPGKRKNEV